MKKVLIVLAVMLFGAFQLNAQKIGYINTEKILSAVPEYRNAQEKLETLGNQYRSKIEAEYGKIEAMYQSYQQHKAGLSAASRQQQENEIISKEKAVKELQKTYFGEDGLMQKKSREFLDPIRQRVTDAINKIAQTGDFMIIFDVASMQGVAYASEKDDLSDAVIKALGY